MAKHCSDCEAATATLIPDVIYCEKIATRLRREPFVHGDVPSVLEAFVSLADGDNCRLPSDEETEQDAED